MNCGFEDVETLDSIMLSILQESGNESERTSELSDDQLLRALDEYSAVRSADSGAIVDLALENYVEMRAKVVDYAYLFRKRLEAVLHRIFPRHVIPLYTMVSFTSIPYSAVVRQWNRQTVWLRRSIWAIYVAAAIGVGVMSARILGLRAAPLVEIARMLSHRK
ncbi:kynurenine 3-monooxygenase, mitochondrial precursor [Kickxella alabastrina]|uniref:Kynurenine 3-monooxygenase, mitochondrial n=1 Tax=Kickxella alabastrina TaxID=61397 RepID=A0ACC1I310_9FUNG|nr:kynurenine 3-monooxygenase, mitochondrial precursor [Kickxella alabastrina]